MSGSPQAVRDPAAPGRASRSSSRGYRLKTASGVVIGSLLIALLGATGMYALRSMIRENHRVIFDRSHSELNAVRLKEAFERKSAAARGSLLSGDQSLSAGARAARADFLQTLAELREDARNDQSRALLDRIARSELEHQQAFDRAPRYVPDDADDRRLVHDFEREILPRRNDTTALLGALIALKQERTSAAITTARGTERQALWLFGALAAACLLIGALVSPYIVHWLWTSYESERRAREFEESAHAVSRGELARLESLLMDAPAVVTITQGPDHVLTYLNRQARQIWPLLDPGRALRAMDSRLKEVSRRDQAYRSARQCVTHDVCIEFDWNADGEQELKFFTFIDHPMFDAEGQVQGIIEFGFEVTELVQAKRFAEQSKLELQELNEERERFVSMVSHDLRNPLNAISFGSNMLLGRELPPESARTVARIRRSADRMERIISQLVDFARLRHAGGLELVRSKTDLERLAQQALQEATLAHPNREFLLLSSGEAWGDWDATRIEQVISNLLANAVKHGASGPITLRVRSSQGGATLSVQNDGDPIAENVRPYLFEPFRRGSVRADSLGLGLYIVKEIVRAHGGQVEVMSPDADGKTTFVVELPCAEAVSQSVPVLGARRAESG